MRGTLCRASLLKTNSANAPSPIGVSGVSGVSGTTRRLQLSQCLRSGTLAGGTLFDEKCPVRVRRRGPMLPTLTEKGRAVATDPFRQKRFGQLRI